MVFDAALPGNKTLMATVAWTVVLSVFVHGITANPLARLLAGQAGPQGGDGAPEAAAMRRPRGRPS